MKKIIVLLAMSILLVSCGAEMNENEIDAPVVEETSTWEIINEDTVNQEESLSEEEINAAIEELFNDNAE